MKFNVLNPGVYLFTRSLENILLHNFYHTDKTCKYPKGVYLVKLKKFPSDNTIIFSYMYYNPLLTDCILAYIAARFVDVNLLRSEINDVVVLIDNSLKYSLLSDKGHSNMFAFNEAHLVDVINNINTTVSLFDLYLYLRKLNLYMDIDSMLNLVTLDINSKYYDIIYSVYKQYDSFINYNSRIKEEDKSCCAMDSTYNLIDNTLIVCSDLSELLNKFNISNITINQGPQSRRGEVSFINNYLSHLDIDFRNTLFYHYRHHYNLKTVPGMSIIPKGKFSFRNIHMKLGSVRWFNSMSINNNISINKRSYYTNNSNKNVDISNNNNRQLLFQENYGVVKNMIDNNRGGVVDLQKNIEYFLHNQELIFSDKNSSKDYSNLKYNDKSFDIIRTKKNELTMLISKANFTKISKRDKKFDQKVLISKFLEELSVDYISDLLLAFFFEILIKENSNVDDVATAGIPTLTAFEKFGEKLVNKYLYKKYTKSVYMKRDKTSFSLYKHYNKSKFKIFEEDTFNSIVGGHFVGALIEIELIYQELDVKVGTLKEKEYYLRVDNSIRKILLKHNNMFLHIPQKLPMVCEPKDFIYSQNPVNNQLGGYLLNDVLHTDHIFKNKRGYGESTKLEEKNIVVSLVNGFSKTPYKINNDTLDFIKLYGLEKNIIIDDSEQKIQNFIRNPYGSYSKIDRDKLRSIYSKIVLEKNILNIANCYSGVNKIYFPVRLDQRTRIYCETDYFDYQKNDLAKGLISFGEPGIITKLDTNAIKFFKGFGATMFGDGLDKKSLNYRVKWVDDNSDNILNFRSNDVINKAENKTCFVSFCFEYERFIDFYNNKDKTVFYSYLPIQLDASCNGYQHLALLTRETKIFNNLNLGRSTHDDIPDDFYRYIIEENMKYMLEKQKILSSIDIKSDTDAKLLESINRLIEVSFDRSLVKKLIMTKSYNASIVTLVDHLANNLEKHAEEIVNITNSNSTSKKTKTLIYYTYKNHNVKIFRKDLLNFVMCLKIVIDKISPKIKLLTTYLDNVVKICTKLEIPVP